MTGPAPVFRGEGSAYLPAPASLPVLASGPGRHAGQGGGAGVYQISNMKLILHGIIIESKHNFCM